MADRNRSKNRAWVPPDDQRRLAQRQKQISYGTNTEGFRNMHRLIRADPRLASGGVLPLRPPPADLQTTKRTWDVLIRKWRRALHMFDYVFVDGEDEETTTIDEVLEKQRREWINPLFNTASERKKISPDELLALQFSSTDQPKIPVEDDLIPFLRSPDCFERPLNEAVGEASPQHAELLSRLCKNERISPTHCGIKLVVGASGTAATYPVVPRARTSPLSSGDHAMSDFPEGYSSDSLPPPPSVECSSTLLRPRPIVRRQSPDAAVQ